jgi:hypothetical protein
MATGNRNPKGVENMRALASKAGKARLEKMSHLQRQWVAWKGSCARWNKPLDQCLEEAWIAGAVYMSGWDAATFAGKLKPIKGKPRRPGEYRKR